MESGPADLRATFELFRFYRPEVGIEGLLRDAGVGSMSARQIYHAVHDRPPDSLEAAMSSNEYSSLDIFISALSSVEFQEKLAAHFIRAFPEKRRLFFVHIPKTAGVDLASHLISRFPSIATTLLDRELTPAPAQVFLALKHIVLEIAHSDTIFITGHTPLGVYQGWAGNGIRYRDAVFTVVREPLEQVISQINYTLSRIFSDESPVPPDTAGWRREFAVDAAAGRPSSDEIPRLSRRILHHQGVVIPNAICGFLGGGSFGESLAQTVAHDVEVVSLNQLDAWAEQKWAVSNRSRRNSSEKFLAMADLSPDDRDYAASIVLDDRKYYDRVMNAYERYGGTSVRGAQIAG